MNRDEDFIEVYGEYISLKELGVATLISSALAFTFYFITPYIARSLGMANVVGGLTVTLGVVGATLGFVISLFMTKVKRVVEEG
ncbi:MAG: hypothetical protein B7O98_06560 [Zestosphaera tikiterensis]|uniref:Major facilitator superfamily (MFS) profile domain-containing protein n=1 Tax=Zestosphaera tikiterensis TaxID=1973259 RepID=A0A2R7Y4M7_9CREN|nr:MAG: hypothetical protein B7O98_06560 [Zestosphaera tikiterensis]